MIQIPEKEAKLIKSLLKELGAVVEIDTTTLAKKSDNSIPDVPKPTMDDIVAEVT